MEPQGGVGYPSLPMPSDPTREARSRLALRAGSLLLVAALLAPGAGALTLEEAVHEALAGNERPAILAARRDAARAGIDVARTRYLPSVSLVGEVLQRAPSKPLAGASPRDREELTATTLVDVPLFDPSAAPLLKRARLLSESAELDLSDERRLLVRDVTVSYLLALSSEQVLAAAERRMQYADHALGDARSRAEAGLASINDVTKVELERSTAFRETTRARADLSEAYLVLAYLIAADVEGPLEPPKDLLHDASQPPPAAESLAARARSGRLDVQSRRKLAESWDAYASEPSRRFLPSLGVLGRHELSDPETGSGRADDWSIGVGVTWNLFDAGLRSAERRERNALAGEADLLADVLERQVLNDVERARVEMISAQASVDAAALAVDASRRNAEETFELYRQGLRTALEVADAGNRAFDADVSLTRERLSVALAWVDLLVAVGSDPLSMEPLP